VNTHKTYTFRNM